MDAARQVLRFSIPGSVFLLVFAVLVCLGRLYQHDSLRIVSQALDNNASALVALLASIPIGFVIHQVYYLGFGPFVKTLRSRDGERWIQIDRGRFIFRQFQEPELDAIRALFDADLDQRHAHAQASGTIAARLNAFCLHPDYVAEFPSPEDARKGYKAEWHENWDVVRALVERIAADPRTAMVGAEYSTLSDIYHALGACRTACVLAWVGAITVSGITVLNHHANAPLACLGALAGATIALGLAFLFHKTRGKTWKSAEASLIYGVRWAIRLYPDLLGRE